MAIPSILFGPSFAGEINKSFVTKDMLGVKGFGLFSVPIAWTPPFLVLTSRAYDDWKSREVWEAMPLGASLVGNVQDIISEYHISKLCGGEQRQLIVRSSCTHETMEERGFFESYVCNNSKNALIEAINRIWTSFENEKNKNNLDAQSKMPIIVQQHVRTLAKGHLSNERRVSRRSSTWVCEIEPEANEPHEASKFEIKRTYLKGNTNQLLCNNKEHIESILREVSSFSNGLVGNRLHYEWVWDSQYIWIVQKDEEESKEGSPPGSSFNYPNPAISEHNLAAIKRLEDVTEDWAKVHHIKVFREAGLPTTSLYVLDNIDIMRSFANGDDVNELTSDLKWLCESPIVVRTDVISDDSSAALLLPRTNTLMHFNAINKFLRDTIKKFNTKKVGLHGLCFIFHRFILSRACAWSYARPDIDDRVRIDSSWGLPDGLLFYPHDSFEVDISRKNINKNIRCKTDYLDIDNKGEWIQKTAGSNWDWKPSLTNDEILMIGEYSLKLARYLKKETQTMFFIGNISASITPNILPWYYSNERIEKSEFDDKSSISLKKYILIRGNSDIEKITNLLGAGKAIKGQAIRLRPEKDLLRNKNFLANVARAARSADLVVELEGSILSHAYYVLKKTGAKVKCLDEFNPKPKKQIFGKLVRDLIPIQIQSRGELFKTYKVTNEELIKLLKTKAVEESLELQSEIDAIKSLEEVADVLEVIKSLCKAYGITFDELERIAQEKAKKKGSFSAGIVLLETSEIPLIRKDYLQGSLFEVSNTESSRFQGGYNLKPRIAGDKIVIPLIPPNPSILTGDHEIKLPGSTRIISIRYKEKAIELAITNQHKPENDPLQMILFNSGNSKK